MAASALTIGVLGCVAPSPAVSQRQDDVTRRQAEEFFARLDRQLDALAERGGIFGYLNDVRMRREFVRYLVDLNPTPAQVTDEFLERQWIAFAYQRWKLEQ
jgi:hypothetical protein